MLSPEQRSKLLEISKWPESKPNIIPSQSCWFGWAHRKVFDRLLPTRPAGVYLELGAWTGAGSTAYVTKMYPEMSVICVDTFKGSKEHHRDAKAKQIADQLFDHFCANHWDNRDRVYPIKTMTVPGVAQVFNCGIKPDFIYVDAAHEEADVHDDVYAAIAQFPGAVIFGDDYTDNGHPGVRLAITRLIAGGYIEQKHLRRYDRLWWLYTNVDPKVKLT